MPITPPGAHNHVAATDAPTRRTPPQVRADRRLHTVPFQAPPSSLPVLLNKEWAQLCGTAEAAAGLARWAAQPAWHALPPLGDITGLDDLLRYVQHPDRTPAARDQVLLHLLRLCQQGDRLAGRVVLQVMLPKAIRLARSMWQHPDWTEGPDEARAAVLAAMWVAISTYPLERRPSKVPANLALDTLAVAQRGGRGSRRMRPVREQPCADIALLSEPRQDPAGLDEMAGPADAELWTVLAWGVRTGVLQLQEAQLMARVYGLDAQGDRQSTAALVVETGMSWRAIRQRCHRSARRLGQAALAAGFDPLAPAVPAGSLLSAA